MDMTITKTGELTIYTPIAKQLAEIKAGNAALVFDYENPEDNKRARSYVFKLRQLKGDTERMRKEEKAASLEYGRKVDAAAKAIVDELDEMIEVHATPLAEIEQREKDRIAAIQERILSLSPEMPLEATAAEVADIIAVIEAIPIDDTFAEFVADAAKAKDASLIRLRNLHAQLAKAEADAAELDRLRRAEEERKAEAERERVRQETAVREERIRKEAEERARVEAEQKAAQEREAAARREREAKEAADRREMELRLENEKAEREKAEANARAERIRRETEERMKAEQAERERREKAAADKRRRDKERVDQVRREIVAAIQNMTFEQAVDAMMAGKVPHVTVTI